MKRIRLSVRIRGSGGFSLIEVMVVMVIAAILATGVVFMFANPTAKVKTEAFELLGEINFARSVAVKENQPVTVQFFPTIGAPGEYEICIDTDDDGDCTDEAADDILKEIEFKNNVRFYDFSDTVSLPDAAEGPVRTPPYGANTDGVDLSGAADDQDGITFAGDALTMNPDGTCSQDGALVIYLHSDSDRRNVRGSPYAVVVSSASTGQVTLSRWRSDFTDNGGTILDERWSRK